MALISTFDTENLANNNFFRQSHELPWKEEDRRLVWIAPLGHLWLKETVSYERYSYNGLTQAAASSAVTALQEEYTKNKSYPVITDGALSTETVSILTATIKAVHVGGLMWQVDVDVHEKDLTLEEVSSET